MTKIHLHLLVLFLSLIPFSVFASTELDEELAKYIDVFSLKPLDRVEGLNPEMVSIGRDLFSDTLLSGNRNISCQSCHHPDLGTGDGLPLGLGEGLVHRPHRKSMQGDGAILKRHSQSLWNLGHPDQFSLFWDGRVSISRKTGELITPEEALNGPSPSRPDITSPLKKVLHVQALFPMVNSLEMAGAPGENEIADSPSIPAAWDALALRFKVERPLLRSRLANVYGLENHDDLTIGHIAAPIGDFIASEFQLTDTAYDRYLRGNKNAMTVKEKQGLKVFLTRGRCVFCHSGKLLTNQAFHSVGVPALRSKGGPLDTGRTFKLNGRTLPLRFKTPGLRGLRNSAPYMHNGAFENLTEVINHYSNTQQSILNYRAQNPGGSSYNSPLSSDMTSDEISFIFRSISVPFLRRPLILSDLDKSHLFQFLWTAL